MCVICGKIFEINPTNLLYLTNPTNPKKNMQNRKPESHKGENGRVMIIGGNATFHGAPILCALGAEYSGVDLVFPFIPLCHAEVARTYSLNFIIHPFVKDHLSSKDVKNILDFSDNADVVVMGPGLGKDPDTLKTIKILLSELKKPVVLDASAIIYTNNLPEVTVFTPHRGEFRELTGDEPTPENVQKWAKNLNSTIICKGPQDIIADPDELTINKTGNSLMTVGGTGDVLGGFIGGLMAQGYKAIEACQVAANTFGLIAESLAESQASVRAQELAELIPHFLHNNQ
jgi:ADP-dependent NAD(P)H-hydrate dehydratase / NAD(P)H-hydrate epimerase